MGLRFQIITLKFEKEEVIMIKPMPIPRPVPRPRPPRPVPRPPLQQDQFFLLNSFEFNIFFTIFFI